MVWLVVGNWAYRGCVCSTAHLQERRSSREMVRFLVHLHDRRYHRWCPWGIVSLRTGLLLARPSEMLKIWEGGLASHGVLLV